MKRTFRSAYFQYKRHYEDPFYILSQTRPDLFKGGHVLDVGANIGYTALVFSQLVDHPFKVFAFEPEPENYSLLEETIESRGVMDTVTPIHAAVGAKDGTGELWLNETHPGDHRILTPDYRESGVDLSRTAMVPMTSIDSFAEAREIRSEIAFVKIDVQGYELPVCEGMDQTLSENPHISIAVEYSPNELLALGFEPGELRSYFSERGFFCHAISRDAGLTPVLADRWEDRFLRKRDYVDLLFSRNRLHTGDC